jgi:hypothetical protein
MAATTIQTTSARPHRVLLRFLLCALILVAIVPRTFPFALATTTDTDGVVEFGKVQQSMATVKSPSSAVTLLHQTTLPNLGTNLLSLGIVAFISGIMTTSLATVML